MDNPQKLPPTGFLARLDGLLLSPLHPPGLRDLYFYTLGLRTTIAAGVPLIKAFDLMARSVKHRQLQRASLSISRAVASGTSLPDALRSHKHIFSNFFINALESGLHSGSIIRSLDLLVEHYEWLMNLRTKIMRLIWYPLINLFLGTLIVLFRDLIIIFMSHAFNWDEAMPLLLKYLEIPAGSVFLAFIISRVLKDPRVRPATDYFIVGIPVLGKLYANYAKATFFQLFATSVEAGRNPAVSYREALNGMNNYYLARKLARAEKYILSGESVSFAVEQTGVFDRQALGMMVAGEESGSLPELCHKMAEYYRSEIYHFMPGCITAFFPLMMVMVAIAFATIAFNITTSFLSFGIFFMCLLIFMVL